MARKKDRKSRPLSAKRSGKRNLEYQYHPLPAGSIRLIRILPGEPSARIRCMIVHRRLRYDPEYDAVSYAWGNKDKTRRIYVQPMDPSLSEMTLPVTVNCFHLLKHLRNTAIPNGEIWIDAICINQANGKEKEKQVTMMGEIFKVAERVLVYPGDVHQDDAKKMEDLRTHIEVRRDDRIPKPLGLIATMERILRQEWFWRTWVLQEVVLARRPEIILGTDTSPWMDFTRVAEKISRFAKRFYKNKIFKNMPPIVGLAESIDKGDDLKLHDLLKRTQRLSVSDDRDKVFALLGIASPNPTYSSLVQYGRTTAREIYAAFARAIVVESGTLDVLSSSANIQLTCLHPDECLKATWAPHWSARPGVYFGTSIASKNIFNANAGLPASISEATAQTNMLSKVKRPPWNILAVRGRRIGFVSSSIWEPYFYTMIGGPKRNEVSSKCREACATAEKCSRYPEESVEHICFRTFNFHLPAEQDPVQTDKLSNEFWKTIDDCGKMLGESGLSEPGLETFYANILNRKVCSTDSGYFCLVPRQSIQGDLLCCLAGGSVPYVLRQCDRGNEFKLVGECYIHGVMQGEALQGAKLEDLEVFQLS